MGKKFPTAIDLFAGAGGLSYGLQMAGWKPIAACDFDPSACDTYRANIAADVFCGDVRNVDWARFRGKASLVAGGPPCQPFSVAGNQLASADTRDMLPEFVRAVKEVRPKLFLMENVAGLVSARNLTYFEKRLDELRDLGYEVTFKVLNAADYGVPQERLRVIVVGTRLGRVVRFPARTYGTNARSHRSAGEALEGVAPDVPNNAITTYARNPVVRPSPWAGMLVNGGGRPINLGRPSQTIPASAGGNRTHILDEDGVLLEYHQQLLSGGKIRSGLVPNVRRLTARESARLQSFPDTFSFTGERSSIYRQIGNAVPPLLAKAVGKSLMAALENG